MDAKASELRLAMEAAKKKADDSFVEFQRLDEQRIAVCEQNERDMLEYEEAVVAYAAHLGIPDHFLRKGRIDTRKSKESQ
jgi:hypothetical protein